jgi:DNA-binding transcriptional LysR family regulator
MHWADRIGRRLRPRDLHVFLSVAQHGNMAKAAEHLAISRPVVSKTIAELEHTLGVPLLDRSPQGVTPTLYGRALVKRSVVIFDELRQSVKEIEFLADPNAGELRIGCTEVMAAGLVSTVIDRLSSRYPKLVFRMELGNAATLPQSLRERRCELAIARQLAIMTEPDMVAEPLFFEKYFVAAGPGNRWLGRRKISLADLVDEPWILTHLEIQSGSPVFEAFRAIKLDVPAARIVSDSLNLRNSLLATGRFLTMIPASALRFGPEYKLVKVLPIEIPRWRLPIAMISLRNRTLSPAAELFMACAREISKPLANDGSRFPSDKRRTGRQ